jgi:hypothetical protein
MSEFVALPTRYPQEQHEDREIRLGQTADRIFGI